MLFFMPSVILLKIILVKSVDLHDNQFELVHLKKPNIMNKCYCWSWIIFLRHHFEKDYLSCCFTESWTQWAVTSRNSSSRETEGFPRKWGWVVLGWLCWHPCQLSVLWEVPPSTAGMAQLLWGSCWILPILLWLVSIRRWIDTTVIRNTRARGSSV